MSLNSQQEQREQLNPLFDYRVGLTKIMPGLIIFFVVAVANIATNSLLIYLMQRIRRIGDVTHVFILCLCISDICVGFNQILCVVLRVFMDSIDREVTHWLALVSFFLSYLFEPLSAALLILVAMDRYIHLRYLTRYSIILTKRRAKTLTKACISINICFTTSLVVAMMNGVYEILNLTLITVYIIMLMAVTMFYVTAYRSVKTRVRDSTISSTGYQRRRSTNGNKSIFRGIVVILLSLLACYAPFIFLTIGRSVLHLAGRTDHEITFTLAFAYGIKCLSASINAIVLIAMNKEYKRYVLKFISNRCGRGTRVSQLASPEDMSTIENPGSKYADCQQNTETAEAQKNSENRQCMERVIATAGKNLITSNSVRSDSK